MRTLPALPLLTAFALLTGGPLLAQIPPAPHIDPPEPIEIQVGDIFEMLPIHTIAEPKYAWILTQDRTFLKAGRSITFRDRFIQPGLYYLDAEILSINQEQRIKRRFAITVHPRQPGSVVGTEGSSAMDHILDSLPPPTPQGHVVLREQSSLLQLKPIHSGWKPINVDFDAATDSDNDGNPGNDVENKGTFLQTDAEPLTVWFTEPLSRKSILVSALQSGSTLVSQTIDVISEATARDQGLLLGSIHMGLQHTGRLQISVAPVADGGTLPTTPMLYTWTFGDGTQSLQTNETHVYAEPGTYTVRLTVRDLLTGKDISTDEQTVTVEGPATPTSDEQAIDGGTQSPDDAGKTGVGGTLRTVLLLALVFIVSVVLGLLVVFGYSKWKKGQHAEKKEEKEHAKEKESALQDHFAAMEQKLIKAEQERKAKGQQPQPSAQAPVTPEIVTERERSTAVEKSSLNASAERINEKNAPSWLTAGLQGKTAATPTSPPPSAPTPPSVTPKPTLPPPPPPPAPVAPNPQTIRPHAPIASASPIPSSTSPGASSPTPKTEPVTQSLPPVGPAPSIPSSVLQAPKPSPTPGVFPLPSSPGSTKPPTPPSPPLATVPSVPSVPEGTQQLPPAPPAATKPVAPPTPPPKPRPPLATVKPPVIAKVPSAPPPATLQKPTITPGTPSTPAPSPAPTAVAQPKSVQAPLPVPPSPQSIVPPSPPPSVSAPKSASASSVPPLMKDIPPAVPEQKVAEQPKKNDEDPPIAFIKAENLGKS